MAAKVYSGDTNDALRGTPSDALVRASEDEGATGLVAAYRDSEDVWQYVPDSQVDHYRRNLREDVVTVYVA